MRNESTISAFLDRLSDPRAKAPVGSSAALAGSMAASLLAGACSDAIDLCRSEKAEDELRGLRDRVLAVKRDLLALAEQSGRSSRAAADLSLGSEADRLTALMFASEVPLRIAGACHRLLDLTTQVLGRAGTRGVGPIATSAALALAGAVGGVVTARGYLAEIPEDGCEGAAPARERAARLLAECEALRATILERVRPHLP